MLNSTPAISILQKVGITQTLLYLYQNQANNREKAVKVTQIINGVNAAGETVCKAIDYLVKNKLIIKEKTPRFPFTHLIYLTPPGERVGKLLDSLNVALLDASRKEQSKL